MMKRELTRILSLMAVSFSVIVQSGCAKPQQPVNEDGPYAEKIGFSEVQANDRLIIVAEEYGRTISERPRTYGVDSDVVRGGTQQEKQVINYIADTAQIFTAEPTGQGLLLQDDKGYLCVNSEEQVLGYLPEKATGCYWNPEQETYMKTESVNAEGSPETVYLGYRTKNGLFSYFFTKKNGDLPDTGTISLYRINDSYDKREKYEHGYNLKVLQTSDIHGFIAFDDGTDWQQRFARNAFTINQARSTTGQKRNETVVLLDGGDVFQGSLLTSLLGWQPLSAEFDALDYDAVAIGNHEFDKGLRYVMDADGTMMDYTLNGESYVNTIPYVTCNLYLNGKKVEGLRDYVILDKVAIRETGEELPVKIGVIGFAENYGSAVMAEFFNKAGYEIREDYAYAESLAKQLKEEGCNAVILLCHGDSGEIANHLSEGCDIDLVLGGHLHVLQHGETPWGLKYASPGNKSDSINNADFVFDQENGKTVLKAVKNVYPDYITQSPKALYDTPENMKTMDRQAYVIGNDYLLLLRDMLATRIGYITRSAGRYDYLPDGGNMSTSGGNWQASMIQRIGGGDIGITNSGGIREDYDVPEDTGRRYIKAGDVYTMFPFDDPVITFELTYEELLSAFEYSFTSGGHGLLSRMVGIDVYYDLDQEIYHRVLAIVTYDGEAIYDHGVWKEGWKDRKVKLATRGFCAESDRTQEADEHNPLTAWRETSRVVSDGLDIADGALNVLGEEAKANNGELYVDTRAHYINKDYIPSEKAGEKQ